MLFGDVTTQPDASSIPATKAERANQRNAVLAGFLGWTFDAFDFFVLTFILTDVAQTFFPGMPLEQSRPKIVATIALSLAMRPVGAFLFGIFADRFGRRLSLFIITKVKESEAWHEHKTDWATYRRSILQHWPRFLYLVALMAMMNFISHGTQDLYPTYLQTQRHYSAGDTANLTMIANVGAVLGGLLFGYYSDRAGRKKAMVIAAFCALVVVPLWIMAPTTALIAVGVFLMQFFVQGAWGVIPAHINELSPGHLRGFFPGFAYQLGVLVASSITYVESVLGEHFTYGQAMGVLAASVMVGVAVVTWLGPEQHRVSFRKDGSPPA